MTTAKQKAAIRKWQLAGAAAKKKRGKLVFTGEAYLRSHGKSPKGRGNWAFGVGKKTHFVGGNMSLSQAKKALGAKLHKHGFSKKLTVQVLP